MKRNLIYSGVVFVLLFTWIFAGGMTQLSMGILHSGDLGFVIGISLLTGGIFAGIFFVIFRAIRNKFSGGVVETVYQPTRKLAIVAGTLFAVSLVGSVMQSYSVGKGQMETARAEAKRKDDAAKALAERQEKEKQRLAAMTPEEREAEVKRKEEAVVAPIIQEGEAMLKRRREREAWGAATLAGKKVKEPDSPMVTKVEWASVKAHLSSIKSNQPHFDKAQALLVAMAEEDKKAAAADAAFQAGAKVEARKEFAKRLEQVFIEKRMNTDVSASGPKNTVLTIRWALASKVTAHDLTQSGILNQAEEAGFTKVKFTDGYDFGWSWELKPKAE